MEKSTVYFTDFRCRLAPASDKLKKLCVTAGIKDIDMDGKFVAIKMHFGELGNLAAGNPNSSANELLDRKMAEYAQAVCQWPSAFPCSTCSGYQPQL